MKKIISMLVAVLFGFSAALSQGPPSRQGLNKGGPARIQSSKKFQNFDKKKHRNLKKSKAANSRQ